MIEKKHNRGGARAGAGRKPKAEEMRLAEKLTQDGMEEIALKNLFEKVKEGDKEMIKLYFQYLYGTPRQKIEQETTMTVNSIELKDILSFDDDIPSSEFDENEFDF